MAEARKFTTAANEAALILNGGSSVEFVKNTFTPNQQRDILSAMVNSLKSEKKMPSEEVVQLQPETASTVLQTLVIRFATK